MKNIWTFSALLSLAAASAVFAAEPQTLGAVHQKAGLTAAPETAKCVMCHGGSYEQLAANTKVTPNPHGSHMGQLDCTACHNWNGKSNVMCNDCHNFENLKLKK
jgi:hypothetical protein